MSFSSSQLTFHSCPCQVHSTAERYFKKVKLTTLFSCLQQAKRPCLIFLLHTSTIILFCSLFLPLSPSLPPASFFFFSISPPPSPLPYLHFLSPFLLPHWLKSSHTDLSCQRKASASTNWFSECSVRLKSQEDVFLYPLLLGVATDHTCQWNENRGGRHYL